MISGQVTIIDPIFGKSFPFRHTPHHHYRNFLNDRSHNAGYQVDLHSPRLGRLDRHLICRIRHLNRLYPFFENRHHTPGIQDDLINFMICSKGLEEPVCNNFPTIQYILDLLPFLLNSINL